MHPVVFDGISDDGDAQSNGRTSRYLRTCQLVAPPTYSTTLASPVKVKEGSLWKLELYQPKAYRNLQRRAEKWQANGYLIR